jgi:1-acyl-sn-glycerol-3-phosphate acyltransferase
VAATALVVDLIGLPPDVVALVPPGALPKTSSGKIRRNATRDLYERGDLARGRPSAWRQWAGLLGQNLLWRVRQGVARLLSALFTLYLWILVGAGLVVLRALLVFARRPEQGGRVSRAWCRAIFRIGTFRVRYPDASAFDGLDGAVFVANHASFMDALLLRAALPARVRMVAKDRLLGYFFVGPLIAGSNVIAITRGQEASAQQLAALVRDGGSFAIFPEGTFTRAPGLLPFRLGAFRAAVESQCPVVPVAVKGTRRAWPDETLLVRRMPLEVTVTAPIHPQGAGWPEMVRLRDRAREVLAAATGEPAFRAHSDDTQARASGRM